MEVICERGGMMAVRCRTCMVEKWEWESVRGKMVVRKKGYGSCERVVEDE